eukprot:CAMPEP_0174873176 /NCGR_PEP_ID=MMETSP1114-20130205/74472_1 /TAXON_ID=312471 /ORGANISM="Neobodo designis, Strain CCAP 1951/1" /LENGTH=40 /DNA_ID= /DNA_START= /DNA_END= /DNA_ORIENTATION=
MKDADAECTRSNRRRGTCGSDRARADASSAFTPKMPRSRR